MKAHNQIVVMKIIILQLLKKEDNIHYQKRKKIMEQYFKLKDKYPNKGNIYFASTLGITYSCLLEWIKQHKFIDYDTEQ